MQPTCSLGVSFRQVEHPEANRDHNQAHEDYRPDILPELQGGHTIQQRLACAVQNISRRAQNRQLLERPSGDEPPMATLDTSALSVEANQDHLMRWVRGHLAEWHETHPVP